MSAASHESVNGEMLECVWDAGAVLGESPLYDPRNNALLWLDIKGGALLTYCIDSGETSRSPLNGKFSALALRAKGGYVAANQDGFHFLERSGPTHSGGPEGEAKWVLTPRPAVLKGEAKGNRFNDGKADPFGGFWAGTMDDQEINDTAGNWWHLSPSGDVQCLRRGFHVTNGPAFDPHRQTAYFTDSARRTVFKARYEAPGELTDVDTFKQFKDPFGYPDGMTVDAKGCLWIAFWDEACIRRFSPQGDILQKIPVPALRPTSLVFAKGALFITSASIGLSQAQREAYPLSGGLFRIKTPDALSPDIQYFKG